MVFRNAYNKEMKLQLDELNAAMSELEATLQQELQSRRAVAGASGLTKARGAAESVFGSQAVRDPLAGPIHSLAVRR